MCLEQQQLQAARTTHLSYHRLDACNLANDRWPCDIGTGDMQDIHMQSTEKPEHHDMTRHSRIQQGQNLPDCDRSAMQCIWHAKDLQTTSAFFLRCSAQSHAQNRQDTFCSALLSGSDSYNASTTARCSEMQPTLPRRWPSNDQKLLLVCTTNLLNHPSTLRCVSPAIGKRNVRLVGRKLAAASTKTCGCLQKLHCPSPTNSGQM